MLVLNGFYVMKIHLEGVAQPAEPFLDERWLLACLIKKDTCPDTEGMRGVFLEIISWGGRLYLFDCFTEECGNLGTGDIEQWNLHCSVTGHWHIIRLAEVMGLHDHLQCPTNGAYCSMLSVSG
jgi:hypothetical protein